MNKKIVAEEQVGLSNCNGCCFDNGLGQQWLKCNHKEQTINGLKFNCTAGSGLIYKEEKNMNDMPELKAGMIVEGSTKQNHRVCKYFYLNKDVVMDLNKQNYCSLDYINVFKVYRSSACVLNDICDSDYFTLIWSKQSPNEKKISEIEKTIEDLQKQVKELKA